MKTFFLYVVLTCAVVFGYFLTYQLGYSHAQNDVHSQVSLGSCVESTATSVKDGINRLIN